MRRIFVANKSLPPVVVTAMRNQGLCRDGIDVIVSPTAYPAVGGKGRRTFMVGINLISGASKSFQGSWGGTNAFEQKAADYAEVPVLPDTVVLTGSNGGRGRTFGQLYIHPANAPAMILSSSDRISDGAAIVLEKMIGLKSSYRAEELRRYGITYSVSAPEVMELLAKGLAKANKRGSLRVTTEGKVLRSRFTVRSAWAAGDKVEWR